MAALGLVGLIVVVLLVIGALVVTILFRDKLRRLIVATADFLIIFLSLVVVIVSAVSGAISMEQAGRFSGTNGLGIIGFILGAGIGFLVACILAATFLLLAEIAKNTRRVLAYYEPEAAAPAQQQYAEPQYYDDRGARR
ncbi:MAG: hypothetical protein KF794_04615 [Xanthobacteraceae bacterium]|nr:hypothetical protein [Xanthobacteraceae bacterium]QYK45981.1 MAG: hypothetical protein KF794_04615 [Xanthobacteraceae bacterium]